MIYSPKTALRVWEEKEEEKGQEEKKINGDRRWKGNKFELRASPEML